MQKKEYMGTDSNTIAVGNSVQCLQLSLSSLHCPPIIHHHHQLLILILIIHHPPQIIINRRLSSIDSCFVFSFPASALTPSLILFQPQSAQQCPDLRELGQCLSPYLFTRHPPPPPPPLRRLHPFLSSLL